MELPEPLSEGEREEFQQMLFDRKKKAAYWLFLLGDYCRDVRLINNTLISKVLVGYSVLPKKVADKLIKLDLNEYRPANREVLPLESAKRGLPVSKLVDYMDTATYSIKRKRKAILDLIEEPRVQFPGCDTAYHDKVIKQIEILETLHEETFDSIQWNANLNYAWLHYDNLYFHAEVSRFYHILYYTELSLTHTLQYLDIIL